MVARHASGTQSYHGDVGELTGGDACRGRHLGDGSAEIVVGQRLRAPLRRSAVGLVHALRAMDGVAVNQQPVRAGDGLDHAVDAEEAARGLDHPQTRLPQAGDDEGAYSKRGEARGRAPLQQHQPDERYQDHL